MKHVDDFIDEIYEAENASAQEHLAADFFEAHRRPALEQMQKPYEEKLFCLYKGKRYRVTGCSRLGDIWLSADYKREMGYELRVDVAECSDWTSDPAACTGGGCFGGCPHDPKR